MMAMWTSSLREAGFHELLRHAMESSSFCNELLISPTNVCQLHCQSSSHSADRRPAPQSARRLKAEAILLLASSEGGAPKGLRPAHQ